MGFDPLSLGLMAGGGLLQGFSSIQQGNAAAEAGKARQNELNIDAQNTEIAAKQSQASRIDELSRTLGTIRATVAGRGLDLSSPSAMALEDAARGYTQRDITRANFNAMQNASNARLAGAQARLSGKMAQMSGYVRAGTGFFKTATQVKSYFDMQPDTRSAYQRALDDGG